MRPSDPPAPRVAVRAAPLLKPELTLSSALPAAASAALGLETAFV